MPKLNEIIDIRKDIAFGGAVQTDWFYEDKALDVSKNFVFHGPDFFGVTDEDVEFKDHKLMDTCNFSNLLLDKLYTDQGNPILMTIAGYGTGKSHLAVTLGKYFEDNNSKINREIFSNIKKADSNIATSMHDRHKSKNIVIVLNGMRDFNLNLEVLSCAKKVLNNHGYSDEFFSDFTKAYTIATTFIDRNYDRLSDRFKHYAEAVSINTTDLKEHLLSNIYSDKCFDLVNEVYNEVTGTYIRWDEGISAGEVLKKLNDKLCGENGEFNKILILFDEFGRYIEYASEYPARAGDSALQQIFEAIQDSNNQIIFAGFIQSDLKTYLSRVKKSSSISRYVGRYESGDKIYLSSNLETIFANLIYTKDVSKYKEFILPNFVNEESVRINKEKFHNINEWVYGIKKKGLWKEWSKYNSVVLQGIFPFDPITTMIITSLSDWYQQRSALNFLMKSFPLVEENEIGRLGELPKVLAIDIIKGDFFEELILAEKEGRQKSENCMLYEKVLIKHQDKLDRFELDVLASILIYKLGKFKTKSKDDLALSLNYFSNVPVEKIQSILHDLEYSYGVIGYDERKNVYDFIEDATGINDFRRFLRKSLNDYGNPDIEFLINTDIKDKLNLLTTLESSFGKRNNIRTNEWNYEQDIITAKAFNSVFIDNLINEFKTKKTTDKAKGKYIYIYISKDDDVDKLVKLYKNYKLDRYPFIFMILNDVESRLYDCLLNLKISSKFTEQEVMKYSKFITKFVNDNNDELLSTMRELITQKEFVLSKGIENINKRIPVICNDIFENLYTNVISFPFDGFSNKSQTAAKKILCGISRSMLAGMFDYQWVQTQAMDVRNRIDIVLKNKMIGWGVVNDDWKFTRPTNNRVLKIFDELDKSFNDEEGIELYKKYDEYTSIPYGLNDYSFSLLLSCYVVLKGIEGRMLLSGKFVKNSEWSNILYGEKGINVSSLKKLKFVKVNIEGYEKKYQLICSQIELNKDASKCLSLKESLNELMNESDPPEIFIQKIEACEMVLKRGLMLNIKKEKEIGKLKYDISSGCDKKDFKIIIKATLTAESQLGKEYIDDSFFEYNTSDRNEYEKMVSIGRSFIEENYQESVSSFGCSSMAQVGGFNKWLESMEKELVELKYNKLATATRERRHKVTGNLKVLRQQQQVRENINNFIENVKITPYTSQSELFEWHHQAKELKKHLIDNKDLDERTKNKIYSPLAKIIKQIDSKLEEIRNEISEIFDSVFELESMRGLLDLKLQIENLLDKRLRKEDKDDIIAIGNILTDISRDFKTVESIDNLYDQISFVSELETKYEDNSEDISFDILFENERSIIIDKINKRNRKWVQEKIIHTMDSIPGLNASRCRTYLTSLELIPSFLNDENKVIRKSYIDAIHVRIKELKIESIVELFKQLDSDEMNSCIELLSNLRN